MDRPIDRAWAEVFGLYEIDRHDFSHSHYQITAAQIKRATQHFTTTSEKEVRILCKQDTRENRPQVFKDRDLFLLPVRNSIYAIVRGEGYVDIPKVETSSEIYHYQLDFPLDTAKVGNSEMQHLDYAYAVSLIRTFMKDTSLVLTIRGRKFSPKFSFRVGTELLEAQSVQTEVDAGYEGKTKVVLVEAKNQVSTNTIIRQLYYPFRQWKTHTEKEVLTVFFEKEGRDYKLWQFKFDDEMDYNSIRLVNMCKYKIVE